jgi:hypothetical protein
MKQFDCPSCLEPSFTIWQKFKLGSARKIECSNCGAKISVPWLKCSLFIILFSCFPPLGAFIPFIFIRQHESLVFLLAVMLLGALVGLFILSWLYLRWVPLVEK